MSRRSIIWRVVAVLFVLVNVYGIVMAAMARELAHTGIHVALAALGLYFVWRVSPGRVAPSRVPNY